MVHLSSALLPSPKQREHTIPYISSVTYSHNHSIVLVHGLGGHRERTWTTKPDSNSCSWPRELLLNDLSSARIITWGYPATTFKLAEVVAVVHPTELANNLCNDLRNLREGNEERPLIFIAHSMGGIVVPKALLHSNESTNDIASLVESACGVIFLGTPHCGSEKADFASIFTSILRIFHPLNDTLIEALKSHNPELQDLQRRFN
jgi:alpha-beta hydrolase superfamily lysophospholipase